MVSFLKVNNYYRMGIPANTFHNHVSYQTAHSSILGFWWHIKKVQNFFLPLSLSYHNHLHFSITFCTGCGEKFQSKHKFLSSLL